MYLDTFSLLFDMEAWNMEQVLNQSLQVVNHSPLVIISFNRNYDEIIGAAIAEFNVIINT